MPYLRLTADRRGFENTFLMHVAAPGEAPRVLYWYRTAPDVRIGRPALDDAAMRSLEEQYPGIDFDWADILDSGAFTPVEVEAQIPPRKRKPRRSESDDRDDGVVDVPAAIATTSLVPTAETVEPDEPSPSEVREPPPPAARPDLLGDLMGRGIAASLRDRHRGLLGEIDASRAPEAARAEWRQRLVAADPDSWTTAEAVLAGMATIESTIEEIRRQLDAQDH